MAVWQSELLLEKACRTVCELADERVEALLVMVSVMGQRKGRLFQNDKYLTGVDALEETLESGCGGVEGWRSFLG